MDWETESHASDCKLDEPEPDLGSIASDSKHNRPQDLDIPKSQVSAGPEISEFNDETDAGYDADIEHVYPDGYEDASEPESKIEKPGVTHQDKDEDEEKATQHADLVYRLRRLNCERQSSTQPASHSRNNSGGSSGLKRSHSQECLTTSDDDAVPHEASPMSFSSHRHTRRRVTPSRSKVGVPISASPDHMDVDVEEPSSEKASQEAPA